MNFYDYSVENENSEAVSMKEYEGKVVLVVNTATGCGFTPQYDGLQKMYDELKDEGFVILDFPCNQFANQAPGSQDEIKSFCQLNYGVSFPQFKKIDVNGSNESPLYTYLKSEKGGLIGSKIKWNFTKFLINRHGDVVKRYAPTVKPENLKEDILKELNK